MGWPFRSTILKVSCLMAFLIGCESSSDVHAMQNSLHARQQCISSQTQQGGPVSAVDRAAGPSFTR